MNSTDSADSSRSERLHSLLSRAASLPAAERDVFLSRECGGDEALRTAVYEQLLAESRGMIKKLEGKPGPVTSAVQQALAGSAHDRRVELLGKVVGDYRLVAIVGAGGVGTVYLGERADRAYSAQVAIKVVANTQLSHEVQRRFAAERQILANLNHPYIGRLLDAGETFFDEPFLVMEYVHGEPIDRYCNNQRLSLSERIQLFLKVCDAVQYAHRNLIVHRDLKPGNILVSKEGIPKLLDFGIAKLLDDSAQAVLQDGVIAHTRVHDRLLTPEYASPEQIRGQAVTTASDVYSLGVVLYELLTGVRPYTLHAHNQLALEQAICIQDPLKPSQMTTALAKESQTATPSLPDIQLIPAARCTTFSKLNSQLKGDLDAIVMKALRKEPEHRYRSVEHLIEDLNRHLNQEPVEARQGNRWYHTQRFIKRHTLGVISATAAMISLIAVAIILSIQANRLKEQRDLAKAERDKATQESQRAETVSNFMLDVFTAADPFQSQDKQVTAKELLDKAANKIETSLNDQPEVKARLLEAIGEAYKGQNQIDLSIKYLEAALQLQRKLPGNDTAQLATILGNLGHAYLDRGRSAEADRALSEARNLLESSGATSSMEYLQLLEVSGMLARDLSHLTLAQEFYSKALGISQQLYGNVNAETANALLLLGQIMEWKSDYAESERLMRQAVSIFHTTLTENHPDRIIGDIYLAELLLYQGKTKEPEILLINALRDQRAIFGDKSVGLLFVYDVLVKLYLTQQRWELAEQTAGTALSVALLNYGRINFNVGITHSSLAKVLLKRGKLNLAEKEARIALKILRATTSPDHQYIASAEYFLAASLVGQHHAKEAEPILHENMARWTRAGAAAWRIARSESLLGVVLLQKHKPQEAKQHLIHADEMLSAKNNGAYPDDIASAQKRVEEFQRCEVEHRLNKCELPI